MFVSDHAHYAIFKNDIREVLIHKDLSTSYEEIYCAKEIKNDIMFSIVVTMYFIRYTITVAKTNRLETPILNGKLLRPIPCIKLT